MPELHETRAGMRVLEVVLPAIAVSLKTIADNTAPLGSREKVKIELELIPDMVQVLREITTMNTPVVDTQSDYVPRMYIQAAREILDKIDS